MNNSSIFFIPNFKLESSLIPSDSVSAPKSFPIEFIYIKKQIENITLVDSNKYNDSIEESISKILLFNPKYVFISSAPSYLFWRCPPINISFIAFYTNKLSALNKNIKFILVGPHSGIDCEYIKLITKVNYLHIGEIDNLKIDSFNEFSIVNSKYVRKLENLDYSLSDLSGYEPHCWNSQAENWIIKNNPGNYSLVEASRGCIHSCSYCFRLNFRNKLRIKNLEFIENELIQLKKMGVTYIFFIDENFGYPWTFYSKVIQLCKKYEMLYGIQTRPDIWNTSKLNKLELSDCIYVELGVEANEVSLLNNLHKFKDNSKALEITKKFEERIRFVNKNILDLSNPDYSDFANIVQIDNHGNKPIPIIPYPSTSIADKVFLKYSKILQEFSSWEKTEILYTSYLIQNGFSTKKILRSELVEDTISSVIEYYKKSKVPLNISRYEAIIEKD